LGELGLKILNSRIPKRTGLLGKVQEFGKAKNIDFIRRNPELTTAASLAALGTMGINLMTGEE